MRKVLMIGLAAITLSAASVDANAGVRERTVTGVAIGAGAGAVIAGPPGAIVGGVAGAIVGGPTVSKPKRVCWRDKRGERHCRWR